jgi:hypothetical protein
MKKYISTIIIITVLTITFIPGNATIPQIINAATHTDTTAKRDTHVSDEMYTCKMHQDVMSDKPGKCPKCGMSLVKQKMTPAQQKMMKEGTYVKPKE